jgi:Fe-S-cluster-containing dehydrogenase component/DMSO reductase anchor subunit
MRKGFIFNHNKCVACGACSASCVLENGWDFHSRRVFTFNIEAFPSIAVTNLSMACNHCDTAVCLDGCPTASYYREPVTGAVLIDDSKCIGCRYCYWNCPYDAPKFDSGKRIPGKCNLCYSGLIEGRLPACSNACPTGALEFGEISDHSSENILPWFPDNNLNPGLRFTGEKNYNPLRIIPESVFKNEAPPLQTQKIDISGEWSLIAFSFLTTVSVATIISSLINGIFPDKVFSVSIIIIAGLISLLHLGNRLNAWRAVTNLKTSPLSREILLFIFYCASLIAVLVFQLPSILIVSSVVGMTLLIAIDKVYTYSDKRKSVFFHSGQTFLTALLIASFLAGIVIPFIFIALIKLSSSVYNLIINTISSANLRIRFFRIALLLITGVSLVSGISYDDHVTICLFLTGELFDRIIFYLDFDPLNIKTLINKQLDAAADEKK